MRLQGIPENLLEQRGGAGRVAESLDRVAPLIDRLLERPHRSQVKLDSRPVRTNDKGQHVVTVLLDLTPAFPRGENLEIDQRRVVGQQGLEFFGLGPSLLLVRIPLHETLGELVVQLILPRHESNDPIPGWAVVGLGSREHPLRQLVGHRLQLLEEWCEFGLVAPAASPQVAGEE